jgi:hypothetical protein
MFNVDSEKINFSRGEWKLHYNSDIEGDISRVMAFVGDVEREICIHVVDDGDK